MANAIITDDIIAKETLSELLNSFVLAAHVDTQLSDTFGAGKGDTVNARRPVRFLGTDGPDISSTYEDVEEGKIAVQLAFWKTVPFSFSAKELTLSIEEFSKRYLKPAASRLGQLIENELADMYKHFFFFKGTPGTTPATYLSVANTSATQDLAGVPMEDRSAFYTPGATAALADAVKGLFTQRIAITAVEKAMIGPMAGYNVFKCQSLKTHTVGALGGTPLVDGAAQNVAYSTVTDTYEGTLDVKGWSASVTDILLEGDVFTIANVYSVNPGTLETTGELQTFVVRADATSDGAGLTTLSISPPIITVGAHATVDSVPADGAAITIKTGAAGAQHPQNMAFHKNAVALVFANIEPLEGVSSTRQTANNVSITISRDSDFSAFTNLYRIDALFGVVAVNPGMGIRHTG